MKCPVFRTLFLDAEVTPYNLIQKFGAGPKPPKKNFCSQIHKEQVLKKNLDVLIKKCKLLGHSISVYSGVCDECERN
jgi:hypothetical protein